MEEQDKMENEQKQETAEQPIPLPKKKLTKEEKAAAKEQKLADKKAKDDAKIEKQAKKEREAKEKQEKKAEKEAKKAKAAQEKEAKAQAKKVNKTQTNKPKAKRVTKKNQKPITETTLLANSTDNAPDVPEEMKNDEVTPFPDKKYKSNVKDNMKEENPINKQNLEKEKEEYDNYGNTELDLRYPRQVDPDFNNKIYEKTEFHNLLRKDDTKDKVKDFEKSVEEECNSDFQILPHQQFVKNFMSIDTPYNNLLLYHELGTGKTCSAIGVAEETRAYLKRSGILRKTFIIGNNNILSNFRLQLFNPSKLKEEKNKGTWTLDTCVGESLLSEINEQQLGGKTREQVTKEINNLIDKYYEFVGYRKLANIIEAKIGNDIDLENLKDTDDSEQVLKMKNKKIRTVQKVFNDTLFIIDEAHNVLQRDESKRKRAAKMLEKIATYCDNVRFILLTATPMYNTHQEIIWMVNLMNLNDKRPTIRVSHVFNSKGNFVPEKKDKEGVVIEEGGKQLLKRKLIGYVSYVRGENPFTFPFRIYPSSFANSDNTLGSYPSQLMTGISLKEDKIQHLDLFVTRPDNYQKKIYSILLEKTIEIKKQMPNFEESTSGFAIQWMLPLLSSLTMTYPVSEIMNKPENTEHDKFQLSLTHGTEGLDNAMDRKVTEFEDKSQKIKYSYVQFSYKNETISEHKRIFKQPNLSKYSKKIATICESVKNSTGIILIYSNYLDFGLVPMCLALEEMGMKRYCKADYMPSTMLSLPDGETFPKTNLGKYIMITGSYRYSPTNKEEIQLAVSNENKDGSRVKVVLISGSGAEGIDLKNVRQVHIMEPWYNMNRIEQVIGRAVRNRSHCALPFKERNVEIYMHTSYVDEKETADMYLYRIAEIKAVEIGKISRVLKECAVDCLLNNTSQQNYTKEHLNTTVKLKYSSKDTEEDFEIGDKPNTSICDYMESCSYTCTPYVDTNAKITPKDKTYSAKNMRSNHNRIVKRVRQLFKEKMFYEEDELIKKINIGIPYSKHEIYHTLSQMIKNKQYWLTHSKSIDGKKTRQERLGHLINSGDTYAFQPNDMTDVQASIYERKKPVDIKMKQIKYNMPEENTDLSLLTENDPVLPNVSSKRLPGKKYFRYDNDIADSDDDDADDAVSETSIAKENPSIDKCIEILKIALHPIQKSKKLQKEYDAKIPSEYEEYASFPLAFEVLMKHHGITKTQLIMYTVLKFYDELPFSQKISIVKILFTDYNNLNETNLSQIQLSESEIPSKDIILKIIKSHLQSNLYIPNDLTKEMPQILIAKGKENIHFILTKKGWISADNDITEKEKLYVQNWLQTFDKKQDIIERMHHDFPDLNKIQKNDESLIGFTGLKSKSETETDGYVFKIKNMLHGRNNKGLQCFHKKTTMNYLNNILSTVNNTSIEYNNDFCKTFSHIPIEQNHLRAINEHLLRHLQYTTDKLWYISYECINATQFLDASVSIQDINGQKVIKMKNTEN